MTLRQLWLRINVLAEDHQTPLAAALREARAEAEVKARAAALDDALTRYRK